MVSIKTNDCIKDESVLVEMFNEHFINIVEKTSGIAPESLRDSSLPENDEETVNKILEHYENHTSVSKIKRNQNETLNFDFPTAEVEDINKIIKSLNPRKATGPDGIPVKILKITRNVIDSHLTNIVNRDIKENKFLEDAKTALVRPLHKKNDRDKIQNYRPVSILNGFSKVYERYLLLNSLSNHIEKILSNFIAAYRNTNSSSRVLIRLIENWKKHLDNKKIVGTVLMDLSKAFDCIPHDLLIAKLHAYGFNEKALTFLYSYLKRRKQSVKINDTESFFQILLSVVPQGLLLDLFSLIFLNDLFFFIKEAELANFADDNTIYVGSKDLTELLEILQKECETAKNWFKTNNVIVNPDKFQSMIISSKKDLSKSVLNINGIELTMESSVKLLGIEIDNKLNFEKHISNV